MRTPTWCGLLLLVAGSSRAQVNSDWQEGMAPKLDGPYCLTDNCYTLLGVTRDTEPGEIKRKYRALAKEMHPDKNPSADRAAFQKIASAYEVLTSESRRRAYDWGLDNPMLLSMHLAQYRPVRQLPKSDVRVIALLVLLVVSALQWAHRRSSYAHGLSKVKAEPGCRRRFEELLADELAAANVPEADAKRVIAQQLDAAAAAAGKPSKGVKKAVPKPANGSAPAAAAESSAAVAEAIARADAALMAESDPDGLFPRPAWQDTLVVQLLKGPFEVAKWLAWRARWFVMVRAAPSARTPAHCLHSHCLHCAHGTRVARPRAGEER
jgi:hypothetical protein